MKTRLLNFWNKIQATYWFLPALMLILTIGLSIASLAVDSLSQVQLSTPLGWLYAGGAEGARTLLSTVAGSMITVAGVTFSITIVALSLASSQFGPRLLVNFMRDTGNQVVLGTFVSTFIYCLLVLRTIQGEDGDNFVPNISVSIGVLLAIASLGVLIYFIHHVAQSINVETVIAEVGRELDSSIESLFPKKTDWTFLEQELRDEDDIPEEFPEKSQPVYSESSGYLQAIDFDTLLKLATDHDLLLKLEHRRGEFVAQGNSLVKYWPADSLDDQIKTKIDESFILGTKRIQFQDVIYSVNQLAEIAIRALSTGINDPFTAMSCIDRLGAALAQLAERTIPSGYRYDEDGYLRLITKPVTFEEVTGAAFNQIRRHASSSVSVTIRLLEALAIIAAHASRQNEKQVLKWHAEMVCTRGQQVFSEKWARDEVKRWYQVVINNLEDRQ